MSKLVQINDYAWVDPTKIVSVVKEDNSCYSVVLEHSKEIIGYYTTKKNKRVGGVSYYVCPEHDRYEGFKKWLQKNSS
jgi:hypothetical protein